MPCISECSQPDVYLLQEKFTKEDFRRESLQGMKRELIPLDEKLRNSLSTGGVFLGLGFGVSWP
jgi:hypothetical protein